MLRQWHLRRLLWLTTCILIIGFTQYLAVDAEQRPVVARMRAAEIEDALHVGLTAFPIKYVEFALQI